MAPKHLVVCSDGTWQKIDVTYPTNVAKIKSAIEATNKPKQLVFYDPGVGTANIFAKLLGGAFGWGLRKNVKDCYRFLCRHYEPGDAIYLFGFSRGAYTARSVGGMMYKCGLVTSGKTRDVNRAMRLYRKRDVHPDDSEAREFRARYAHPDRDTDNRPQITFLGCWDTVGSLGVPDINPRFKLDTKINRKYKFHDTKLSNIIKHARHAVAIDEKRKVFDVTPMTLSNSARGKTDLKQLWFAGDHGCIGGGEVIKEPLSDITLNWMVEELVTLDEEQPLSLDIAQIPRANAVNYKAPFDNSMSKMYRRLGVIDRAVPNDFDKLHWSVKARLKEDVSYNPASIRVVFETVIPKWKLKRDGAVV